MTRTALGILVCLQFLLGPAAADDEKPAPPKPLTSEQAADAVSEAVRAKDADALEALAEENEPDPWLVADELCFRGEHDTAEAFAKAAPRVDVEALPAYVAACRKREPDMAERKLLAAMGAAMDARAPQRVIEGTASLASELVTVVRIRLLNVRGVALQWLQRPQDCEDLFRRGADAAVALGWIRCATRACHNAGLAAYQRSAWTRALADWTRGLALHGRRGDKGGAATVLSNIGRVHENLSDYRRAISVYERALAVQEALGDKEGAVKTLRNIGIVHTVLGDFTKSKSIFERVLTEQIESGDKAGVASSLVSLGIVHNSLGDYARALAAFERALPTFEAMADRGAVLTTRGNIAGVHVGRGNYAKALAIYEGVLTELETLETLGDKTRAAETVGNIGLVYEELGDHAKALAFHERALAAKLALGAKVSAAGTLGNIGDVHESRGDFAQALAIQERALAAMDALGDKRGVAWRLGNIGRVQSRLGDHAKALDSLERALVAMEALGDKRGAAWTLALSGDVHRALGNHAEARSALENSVRAARSLRAVPLLVHALTRLARAHLDAGASDRALGRAREALTAMESLLGGLGEEEGATAREQHTELFSVGVLAAAREGNLAEALTFLESGRAGALLDALGNREVLRWKAESLPADLRRADIEATDAQRVARRAFERARTGGTLPEIRSAAKALDEATEGTRAVGARIQREVKRQAGLLYPLADTIETIRDSLEEDQALVLYGLCLDEALALVLRRDDERVVALGTVKDVRGACAALRASDYETDATAPLARLRGLLVTPLKLGADVQQVLVSPEGPLCYLPLGALFEQPVTTTPSGTTHVLLRGEQRKPGAKVLALGDPDYGTEPDVGAVSIYRGNVKLPPLPGTRAEAKAVGDVVLLGAKASEPVFLETVAKEKRWRAVHLACHGLVVPTMPMLSSLALTRAGEDDGFLTGAEVLRMDIPADLVVLSACETATGRIVQGEGIVGLTRAFMYAGSPRVICSLWKVDDAATQALMIKFYELWNPKKGKGLGAAAALKQAQAFIEGQEKWKHPYYWAAWVLWGLPD